MTFSFVIADGGDDGYKTIAFEHSEDLGIDRMHFADMTQIDNFGYIKLRRHINAGAALFHLRIPRHLHFACANQAAILARKANCLATGLVDIADNLLVDESGQYHFNHIHGLGIGNAHAVDKLCLFADSGQMLPDLRAAAMNHDRIDADLFEQRNIGGKTLLELLFNHRIAAIFDDDSLIGEALQIGESLNKGAGSGCGMPDHSSASPTGTVLR